MPLLNSLEKRFGRYAIPGIIGYLVFFQVLTFVVLFARKDPEFAKALCLVPFDQMNGEWWRLISFLALPEDRSPLVFILQMGVMLYIMRPLEEELGVFRLNLLILVFVLAKWLQFLLLGDQLEYLVLSELGIPYYASSALLSENLFFMFAVLHPRVIFHLFGIVPLPVWVLGLLGAGTLVLTLIKVPALWLAMFLSLSPFFIFGIPRLIFHLRHRATVTARRTRFKADSFTPEDSFHRCTVCGRTDGSDPDLDFRVAEDGTEYCTDHVPRPG